MEDTIQAPPPRADDIQKTQNVVDTTRSNSGNSDVSAPLAATPPLPQLYLVIVNIGKFQNVWAMVHGGMAMGCTEILLVGQAKNAQRLLERAGNDAILQKVLRRFDKWNDCVAYMKNVKKIHLIGVEIDARSQPFNDEYFEKHVPYSAAAAESLGILLGNEGQGILPKFLKVCDSLIRIPQYGCGTASLNVNVACSIVLYRFGVWRQQPFQQRQERTQTQPLQSQGAG